MKFAIVSVKDSAVDVFGVPQFAPTVPFAVRGFSDEMNRNEPQNLWFKHPEQFDLYELGEYDDAGLFALLPEPRLVARGRDVARQNAPGFRDLSHVTGESIQGVRDAFRVPGNGI